MSSPASKQAFSQGFELGALRHRMLVLLLAIILFGAFGYMAVYGFSYYMLPLQARITSPLHAQLRPSGEIGLKLGMFGVALFLVLFLYAIRKKSSRLSAIGKTKHWLDFHVVCGIAAPLFITLHSALKFGGIAGTAYWIMMAVAASGFIGRYLYAQIPRSRNATELTLKEMGMLSANLSSQLFEQGLFKEGDLDSVLRMPSAERVQGMSLPAALFEMMWLDISRPFRLSRLRRKFLSGPLLFLTLGGMLPSSNKKLEAAVSSIRSQSWLSTKMLFLDRAQKVFHLWHVIHRPFSYSFAVLVTVHIGVALLMGFY